jgi:hypothetical protein
MPRHHPTPWLRAAVLALAGCGLANPVLRTQDGVAAATRLRGGIASMAFDEGCERVASCTVQLRVGHVGVQPMDVEVAEVRLFVSGVPLGVVRHDHVSVWRGGAYEPWRGGTVWRQSMQLSVELGPIDWSRRLAAHGLDLDPTHHDVSVEVVLRTAGEELAVRSIFTVTPTRWRDSMIMT